MFRLLFKIFLISATLSLGFYNTARAESTTGSAGISLNGTKGEENLLNASPSHTENNEITINTIADDEEDTQLVRTTDKDDNNAAVILPQFYSLIVVPQSAITNTLPIYIILHKYRV